MKLVKCWADQLIYVCPMNRTWYEGWQYGLGITMALTECILTEDLAWSCLLMAELAGTPSVFLLAELLKLPLNILSTQSLHNSWQLKKFLAWFYRILYLETLGGTSAAHPVVNFQSCHARVSYWVNTGSIFFRIAPVDYSGVGVLKIHKEINFV